MMKNGGVIFDFNGTLFWDSEYMEASWDKYLEIHHIFLTKAQKRAYIHGRNGKDTLEYIFKRELSELEVEVYTEEKELMYRNECLKHEMKLAPGATELLDYLNERNIPISIATAAGRSNVDFFIEKFNLLDFFAEEYIIYNDGKIRGKPHPDIFELAIRKLGVKRSESIIFEDSLAGIQAAIKCKVANVIIVNSTNDNYTDFNLPVIKHFDDFDRNLL
jgi:HAD superfamily hydrolase (TIGR01509 family)